MKLSSKKIAGLLFVAGVLLVALPAVVVAGPPWSDAPNSWWVSSYGVTETQVATVADGYPDNTFRPSQAVTRGQFAKMAVNGLGVDTADPATPTFKDVSKTNLFYIYIEGGYAKGLIGGIPTSAGLCFRPGSKITRQQAYSILGKYLAQVEIDTTGAIHGDTRTFGSLDLWYQAEGPFNVGDYDDFGQVASVHKAATAYLIFRGILKGSDHKLNPTAALVRSQAAVLILRVKAEAEDIKTPPGAPSNLAVVANSNGKTVAYDSATKKYVGNDSTPRVTGDTLASRPIAIYDNDVQLVVDSSNSAGKFYTDLTAELADGTHSFTARVKNANGVKSDASAPVTYLLDTVQPEGSVTKPAPGSGSSAALLGGAKPDFTATATDASSGVKQVEFQVAAKETTPSWTTVSIDTTPETGTTTYAAVWPSAGTLASGLTDGQYLFRVVITDNAGNARTSATVEATVDTVKPTVTITAPVAASGSYYTEDTTPDFTATATDPAGSTGQASGIDAVQFLYTDWSDSGKPSSWSGFTPISTDKSAPYAADYGSSALPEGHYIFAVRATDVAGNESALMSGSSYASGVTQEVIIDKTPPVIAITGPTTGQSVEEGKSLTITWALTDVTPPDTVKIEYTLDASASTPVWVVEQAATANDGVYLWTAPAITGDKPYAEIRITAVDNAGAHVGNVAGHTTVAYSAGFTVYDLPEPASNVIAEDDDTTGDGVDGRDFTVTWTPSLSTDIWSQSIYILPAAISVLDLSSYHPVATFYNNTTDEWTGEASLTTDSKGDALVAGSYRIWIVVIDIGQHIADFARSDVFTVTAP